MKTTLFSFLLIILLGNITFASTTSATISGEVYRVESDEHILYVSSPNMETGALRIIKIYADRSTRFERLRSLSQLSKGDAIRVDYVQGEGGQFFAARIIGQ